MRALFGGPFFWSIYLWVRMQIFKSLFVILFFSGCAHIYKTSQLEPTTENVSKVLNDNKVSFRRCYQTDLNNVEDPERLKGQVEFTFTVDHKGSVIKADISSKDIKDQNLLYCMKTALKEIHFPPAKNNQSYDTIQKLDFYPKRTE